MLDYQVLARRYRPQTFIEVLGQEAIVTTLKNAILYNRLAHAYMFCGSRGTGKTTLARVFAKALNCYHPAANREPCNECSSCKEIAAGTSLDVLEIDGASHRGIDDIRQINETVAYSASPGKYKIYIIDEVHMLTKEAFNALLKTLEEPPLRVKFFFATTEPHKVLPTILSRCQRFNLNRIPLEIIIQKLSLISNQQNVNIEEEALRLIANRAEGGMRDAESLLDQILAFHDGDITAQSVADVLGIMPREVFFSLDHAGKEGNLAIAFEIADQVFSQGKDVTHFMEVLVEHFRNILIIKLSGKAAPFLTLSIANREKYEQSAKVYTQEQCLTIIDFLVEAQAQIRFMPSARIALEALLLRILRIHQRISIDVLVRRLSELEQAVGLQSTEFPTPFAQPKKEKIQPIPIELANSSMTVDPTPTKHELGLKTPKVTESPKSQILPFVVEVKVEVEAKEKIQPAPIELGARLTPEAKSAAIKKQSYYDTLLQFAAVELEGSLHKKSTKGF